ncbi:MAG: hypothetical protein EOP04_29025 [Proteobacteria bacterium]|nr:MAG: hypothetical protein EOP04_29025 [Pseudomonadota bacterium]
MDRFKVVRILGLGLAIAGLLCGFFIDYSDVKLRIALSSSNCTHMLMVGLLLNLIAENGQLRKKYNDKDGLMSKFQIGIGCLLGALLFGGYIWFASF